MLKNIGWKAIAAALVMGLTTVALGLGLIDKDTYATIMELFGSAAIIALRIGVAKSAPSGIPDYGWKTIACGAAMLVATVLHSLGILPTTIYTWIMGMFGSGGIFSLRLGIAKASPQYAISKAGP